MKQPQVKYMVFNVNAEAQSARLPLEKRVALGNTLLKTRRDSIKPFYWNSA